MQITNSVVCDTSKGSLYKEIKPPLMGENAFPLTGFVCETAHITVILAISHFGLNSRIFVLNVLFLVIAYLLLFAYGKSSFLYDTAQIITSGHCLASLGGHHY